MKTPTQTSEQRTAGTGRSARTTEVPLFDRKGVAQREVLDSDIEVIAAPRPAGRAAKNRRDRAEQDTNIAVLQKTDPTLTQRTAARASREVTAPAAPVDVVFNSEQARQIVATELDAWATDHHEAATALKAFLLDVSWKRRLVGTKLLMSELRSMEV